MGEKLSWGVVSPEEAYEHLVDSYEELEDAHLKLEQAARNLLAETVGAVISDAQVKALHELKVILMGEPRGS